MNSQQMYLHKLENNVRNKNCFEIVRKLKRIRSRILNLQNSHKCRVHAALACDRVTPSQARARSAHRWKSFAAVFFLFWLSPFIVFAVPNKRQFQSANATSHKAASTSGTRRFFLFAFDFFSCKFFTSFPLVYFFFFGICPKHIISKKQKMSG